MRCGAIQQVVDHINEDTGFFLDHDRIVARLNELEHALDVEISRLAETLDVTSANPALREHAGGQRRAEANSFGRRFGARRRH